MDAIKNEVVAQIGNTVNANADVLDVGEIVHNSTNEPVCLKGLSINHTNTQVPVSISQDLLGNPDIDPVPHYQQDQLFSQAIGRSIGRSILASLSQNIPVGITQSYSHMPSFHRCPIPEQEFRPPPEHIQENQELLYQQSYRPTRPMARRPRDVKNKYRKTNYFSK